MKTIRAALLLLVISGVSYGATCSALVLNPISGQLDCVGSSSASSLAFSAITSGTNTGAAMVVGSGASLTFSGSGTINASTINGATVGTATATSGNLLIGSGSAWVTQAMSGDATITSAGVVALNYTALNLLYDQTGVATTRTAGAKLTVPPSATTAGLNCGAASAPSSPAASDIWCTTSSIFTVYDGSLARGMISNTAGQDLRALSTGVARITTTTGAFTSAELSGDVSTSGSNAVTIAANAVTSAKMAVVNTRRTCTMVVGSDNGAALADADIGPQSNQCFIPFAATVVEVDIQADAGTTSVIPRLRHCSAYTSNICSTWSTADFLSGALAAHTGGFPSCAKTTAVAGLDGGTTCAGTLQNTAIAIGDWVELKSGTATGGTKRLTVSVIYLVN